MAKEIAKATIDNEENTLSILNHFMRERSRIDKEMREDPHKIEKENPALYKLLELKADKEKVEEIDEKKSNRTEITQVIG